MVNKKQKSKKIKKVLGKKDTIHPRFKRKVWLFPESFTSALAKNLVKLSPYVVPDNLSLCIGKFHNKVLETFMFDKNNMIEISLLNLKTVIFDMIKDIPEFLALEEQKKEGTNNNNQGNRNPDFDSISLDVLARSMVVDFAEHEDSNCWLARHAIANNNDGES